MNASAIKDQFALRVIIENASKIARNFKPVKFARNSLDNYWENYEGKLNP